MEKQKYYLITFTSYSVSTCGYINDSRVQHVTCIKDRINKVIIIFVEFHEGHSIMDVREMFKNNLDVKSIEQTTPDEVKCMYPKTNGATGFQQHIHPRKLRKTSGDDVQQKIYTKFHFLVGIPIPTRSETESDDSFLLSDGDSVFTESEQSIDFQKKGNGYEDEYKEEYEGEEEYEDEDEEDVADEDEDEYDDTDED